MNREIKFRAWDNKEKVMLTSNSLSSFYGCNSSDGKRNRHDKHSIMTWDGNVYENGFLQDYVLMQYIGLKDANGVEIYEGDIIRTHYGSHYVIEYSEKLALYTICRPIG